jgi:chemotaxis signal transduction protein
MHTIGLLVDALQGVPAFDPDRIRASPLGPLSTGFVNRFVQPADNQPLIQLLDVASLFQRLKGLAAALPK